MGSPISTGIWLRSLQGPFAETLQVMLATFEISRFSEKNLLRPSNGLD